jgi:DnaK suppressor protein
MNTKEIAKFKAKLLAEKSQLEEEMRGIGTQNPNNKGAWDASAATMEVDNADENEVADKLEEFEENAGILTQLENQLADVNSALDKIEKGTYGLCEKCGEPIEPERLEANPSAKISIKHNH